MPRAYRLYATNAFGDLAEHLTAGSLFNEHIEIGSTFYVETQFGTTPTIFSNYGSFYIPDRWGIFQTADWSYNNVGTLRLRVVGRLNYFAYDVRSSYIDDLTGIPYNLTKTKQVFPGQKLYLAFTDSLGGITQEVTVFLPKIIGTFGTTVLWVGTKGETYYDAGYATLAQGYIGSYGITDIATLSDSKINKGNKRFTDQTNFYENFRQNPLRFPKEGLTFGENFNTYSYRVQSATSWIFSPDYKVLIDLNDTGSYATTNWANRITNYGGIDKAQKHWSGKYETSEWAPTFADENNELFGSMYYSRYDIRDKQIMLTAMITDKPMQYTTQFTGKIRSTKWIDGKVTITANDELRNLVNRKFVFDYSCVGTIINGQQYGIVKQIVGTSFMFDDMGQVSHIQKWSKSSPKLLNVAFQTGLGIWNAVSGNYIGVGLNAAAIGIELGKGESKLDNAYIEYRDDNLIADDTILSGNGIKFYNQSINGTAENSRGPLYNKKEYTVVGGTFVHGIYATVNVDDTTGINLGDFIYVKKPLEFSGDPNTIIRNILCGSNIDFPYQSGTTYLYADGKDYERKIVKGDFSASWNSEISAYANLSLYKQVGFDSNPFDEIKEIIESCQLYFYVDGNNDFAISSIDGKDILRTQPAIATYSDVYGNILDGFSYSKSTEDAYGHLIYKYGYGGKQNEFSRKKEFSIPSSQFETIEKTIESKWVHNDDDAYVLAYRAFQKFGTGYESITLPTTLYGLLNNVGDLIRVNHRTGNVVNKTFEIVSQSKDLDGNSVSFDAENVEYINNQGLCEWGTVFNTISGTSKGGYSFVGRWTDVNVGTIGTFNQALNAETSFLRKGNYTPNLIGRYIGIGSSFHGNVEICAVIGQWYYNSISTQVFEVVRGLFNTISRPINVGDTVYDLGPANLKNGYVIGARDGYKQSSVYGMLYATTVGINPLIGTSFKFF